MKALFPIVLLCAHLSAAPQSFLFPDQMHDARSFLKQTIRKAADKIVAVTPSLRESALSGALSDAAERGVSVTLITTAEPGDARSLVRYANVRLFTLDGLQSDNFEGRLELTLLTVDEQIGCLATLPLIRDELTHSIGILECSDAPSAVHRYGTYLETLIRRALPYLDQ